MQLIGCEKQGREAAQDDAQIFLALENGWI